MAERHLLNRDNERLYLSESVAFQEGEIPRMNRDTPILLAEDDQTDIFLMRRAFREAGLLNPLVVVPNGQEAIAYLNGQGVYADRGKHPPPCVLLLDLRMPLMDGFDVLAWLQKRRRGAKDLQVVILSSSKSETDVLRAFQLGADAFWVKPNDFDELVSIVRQLHERISSLPEVPPWIAPPNPSQEARL
jgi:CheY-like chemotaxis protein